mgnify:CR=1 FL=1
MLQSNILQLAIVDEIATYMAKQEAVTAENGEIVNPKGETILPVDDTISRKIRGILYQENPTTDISRIREELQKGDILQVDMPFIDAIKFASSLVNEDENNNVLYGVVWTSSVNSSRINLLHPIIAMSTILGHYNKYNTHTGVLTIYSLSSPKKVTPVEESINRWRDILAVMDKSVMPGSSIRFGTSRSSLYEKIRSNYGFGNYVSYSTSGSESLHAIVPIQLYTKAMVYPYYGAVLSVRSNNSAEFKSRNIVSMLTGNIRSGSSSSVTGFDSTCVGSLSNSRTASLGVLNNMNLDSMYGSRILPTNWYSEAKMAMTMSAHLYNQYYDLGLFVEPTVEPTVSPAVEPTVSPAVDETPVVHDSYTTANGIRLRPKFVNGMPVYGSNGIRSGTFVLDSTGIIRMVRAKSNSHVTTDDNVVYPIDTLIALYRY